jgi:SAM-dependent methyltransferase
MSYKKDAWNISYLSGDNIVFYPDVEVVRFISKYIKKRVGVGVDDYKSIMDCNTVLDLGCGIGRHVFYLDENGFDAYGVDYSDVAINKAKEWALQINKLHLMPKFQVCNTTRLPESWSNFFDIVVSYGVLDSMPFVTALDTIQNVHRVLKNEHLFYFDVVSGDDLNHYREYSGEEVVNTEFEHDTIQSYFNLTKIEKMLKGYFEIIDIVLVQRESVLRPQKNSRYHVVCKKINRNV